MRNKYSTRKKKKWIYAEGGSYSSPVAIHGGGAGLIYGINYTNQGSGGTNRLGRDFSMKKIELHGEITPHFNAGTSDCLAHEVLVALVYDKKSEAQRPLNNLIFDWDGGSTYRKSMV